MRPRRGGRHASLVDDRHAPVRAGLPAFECTVARVEAHRVAEVELAHRAAPVQLQPNAQAVLDLALLGLGTATTGLVTARVR